MKEFNVIVAGVGGQGAITLMRIIAEAALKQGYDVKTSELHGLAQRGGSVPTQIRFGDKIYSPLVMEGEAHLIIAMEPVEAMRACYFASKENKTVFLVNSYSIIPLSVPILKMKYPSLEEIKENLQDFSNRVIILDAAEKVKKITGNIVMSNIYILGYAVANGLLPLKKENLLRAIEEIVPKKYIEENKKAFGLAFD